MPLPGHGKLWCQAVKSWIHFSARLARCIHRAQLLTAGVPLPPIIAFQLIGKSVKRKWNLELSERSLSSQVRGCRLASTNWTAHCTRGSQAELPATCHMLRAGAGSTHIGHSGGTRACHRPDKGAFRIHHISYGSLSFGATRPGLFSISRAQWVQNWQTSLSGGDNCLGKIVTDSRGVLGGVILSHH